MSQAPSWWRLEMPAPPELEDSLLWTLGSLGISRVALTHDPANPEQCRLLAWLPAVDWPEAERLQLAHALTPLAETFALAAPELQWFAQHEEDWSSSWKQHWQADPVGKRLLILPAWLELPPEHGGRLVIRMDPGSAFGTGSHPTTRLCLEALERLAEERGGALLPRVADLGCGSGILGIAALLLGATSVAAVDTDSLAVRATAENAAVAGMAERLQVRCGSVEALVELLEGVPADLLLCNILAPVIEALAPAFDAVLAPSGVGLLSGLLVTQAPRLQQVLAELGWQASLVAEQSQWGLMMLHKAR